MGDPNRRPWHAGWSTLIVVAMLAAGLPATASPSPDPEPDVRAEVQVEATVVDDYVRAAYEISVAGHESPAEVPIEVRVPDDAYASGLTIERNGTSYAAEVQPTEDAREAYDQARREGRSAGLAEQTRDASVYRFAVHPGAGETVNATFVYETLLVADEGVHELELPAPDLPGAHVNGTHLRASVEHSFGLDEVDVAPEDAHVEREGGVAVAERELGEGPGEDANLTVRYTPAETPRHGQLDTHVENGTGYFAHRFLADADARQLPLDLVLVLDTSGSMSGDKIAQLREAATAVVDQLGERDRLAVVAFDDEARTVVEGPTPVDEGTREQARQAVRSLSAGGSTNAAGGLERAFELLDGNGTERAPAVAFLTDGKPTVEPRTADAIRAFAEDTNDVGAEVHGLALGDDADWSLVHGLAQDHGGTAAHIEGGEGAREDLERFLTGLTAPVLTGLEVAYEGNVTPVRGPPTTLFAGSQVLVAGTFDPGLDQLEAQVSARTAEEDRSWTVSAPVGDEAAAWLPRLVAYNELQDLEDRIAAQGGDDQLEQRARELALEHGFVTDRTSLVLTLPADLAGEAGDGNGTDGNGTDGPANATDETTLDLSTEPTEPEAPDEPRDRATGGSGVADPQSTREDPAPSVDDGDKGGHERADADEPTESAETPAPGAFAALLVAVLAALARSR
jgi:Ca-activated chloride channel family protein